MRLTPLLFALMVSLSVPVAVMAVPVGYLDTSSGDTALPTVGTGSLEPPGTSSMVRPAESGSEAVPDAGSVVGPATVTTTSVSAQEAPIEPGEQDVVRDSLPEEPFATGFFEPQIDGILYGSAGEPLPTDVVPEWADAFEEPGVVLRSPDGSLDGDLYTKQVDDGVYVGLDLEDVAPDSIEEVWIQYDRDGDGALSSGDIRIVAPGPASDTQLTTIEVFDGDGWTDEPFRDGALPTDAGLYAAAVGGDGTFEAELNLRSLEDGYDLPEVVDDQPYYDLVGYTVSVRTTDDTYTIDRESYAGSYLHVPAFRLVIPSDDVGIDHVELTQSVQRADNSLPVIRNKETLARVFVTHDNAMDTEVEVRLTGWVIADGSVTPLGTLSTTHIAPDGALDREVEDHSANFELPDGWTDGEGLLVRAEVRRPGFIEENSADNDQYEFVLLTETFDPAIYYIRLNTGSDDSPNLEPTDDVDAATATLADVYPVADPQFVELDTSVIGSVQGLTPEERLEELNTASLGILLAIGLSGGDPDIPVPAQVFGFTPGYAGISDPAWSSDAASGASLASIGSVDDSAHDRLIMAHEINHNIGNDDWGRHAGDGSGNAEENGCGASGDDEWQRLYDNTYLFEVGWDPSVGIIPTEYPDYQSYCQIWEVTVPAWTGGNDPAQWVSEYRWLAMTDRFENWDGNPVHPDLRSGGASTAASSAEVIDGDATNGAVPTARIVSGFLYEDGSGELSPSFERPGVVPPSLLPTGDVEDPHSVLVVDYADESTREIPLTADFDDRHEEASGTASWPFTVALPDDGTIVGLSLVDPDTGDVLDSLEASEWTLTGVEFDVPDTLERGQAAEIMVNVVADTDRTLYKRLLYSPDGELFYPYGKTFTGSSAPVLFEELPGGEAATFRLLVSDGVHTEFAESPAFGLAHAPPEVSIGRTERWRTFSSAVKEPVLAAVRATSVGGEPTDRVTTTISAEKPVDVGVGQSISLDASGQDEYGNPLPDSAYTWSIPLGGGDPPIFLEVGTGPRFEYEFRLPGTYSLIVEVEDPETGLVASDSILVEVTEPPLPDKETFEAFEAFVDPVPVETTDAPAVSVTPSAIDEGETVTVQIDIEDGDDTTHLVWVDWVDGTRTERVVTSTDTDTDGPLTFSRPVGDDGTIEVTVLDDGFGVGTASVEVSNVAPTLTLSTPEPTTLPGGEVIVVPSGSEVTVGATGVDPGSDDLTFEWYLDGEPLEKTTVFNDGTEADLPMSPDGVFPFSASDAVSPTVDRPHTLSVTVTDDDGGSTTRTLTLLVTGDGEGARSLGYWRHQMAGNGKVEYEDDELEVLLSIVDASSAVFPEPEPPTTVAEAADTLNTAGPEFRPKAEAQLLAAWLNLASGGVTWGEAVDVDGDGDPDRTVGSLLTEADAVVADGVAIDADLERAKDLAEAVNLHDE